MKHYLDFGTHMFQGLNEFTRRLQLDESWNVQCFEANPLVYGDALELVPTVEGRYASFKFHNRAISTNNEVLVFHCRETVDYHLESDNPQKQGRAWSSQGSTAVGVIEEDLFHPVRGQMKFQFVDKEVQGIDVNEIISDIVNEDPNAEIYIKCDIEGSEFEVLPRLLESDNLDYVKEMFIEWHERFWNKTGEMQKKVTERAYLNKELKDKGIKTHVHI